MRSSTLLTLVASVATASAQTYRGFNYGSTFTDGSAKVQSDYQTEFSTAQNLVGTSGFASARLYTMIQPNTANSPIQAIPAAIASKTSLLLGMWASAGEANINNEILALQNAINTYGSAFVDLIVGISVGSEDLYRISPTGIINKSGVGAEPTDIVNYINLVRKAVAGTAASTKPIGHVDTWTAWVNGSNNAVINACDLIGMDVYPYFQNTLANSIENGKSIFYEAYDATLAAVGSKPVWVTETGWPVSGPTENLAVASTQNAQSYWDQVGCSLFGKVNTWWYTLQDAAPTTPSPSFGIVGSSLTTTPLYNLQCPAISSASSSSATTASSSTVSVASASSSSIASGSASVVVGGGAGSTQTPVPGPLPAPSISSVSSATVGPSSSSTQSTASNVAPSSAPSNSGTAAPTSGTAPVSSAATSVQGSSTFATITRTSVMPSASPSSSTCPMDLSGQFEYPHLIVPIDKSQPDVAKGTSYNGTFSSTVSSIYNFDIPASDAGKTCSLIFLLPTQSQLTTSSYTLTGTGGMTVSRLQSPATQQTTYNTCPAVANDSLLPRTIDSVTPGNEYVIASGTCFAGQTVAWEISATGSFSLDYFQNNSPAPIGLYVTVC